jgi:putative tricarboxylic transport membrane protein
MKKLDFSSGIVLLAVALVFGFRAHGLGFVGPKGIQPGFFPLLLSILLGCFSVMIILNACLSLPSTKTPKILGERKDKLFVYVISFSLFGFALGWLGYTLTVALYFIVLLRFVEKRAWRVTLIIAFSSVIISYVLFTTLLDMPLPEGLLTPVINHIFEADV